MSITIEKIAEKTLPTIALRGIVLFPHVITSFEIARKASIKALKQAQESGTELFLAIQRDASVISPKADDLYEIGITAKIKHALRLTNGNYQLVVEGQNRAERMQVSDADGYLVTRVHIRDISELRDDTENDRRLIREAWAVFNEYLKYVQRPSQDIVAEARKITDPGLLADCLGSTFLVKFEDRQQMIEILDGEKRLEALLGIFRREIDLIELEGSIQTKVRYNLQRGQREIYLREQLKAIQSELNIDESGDEESDEYYTRIEEAKLPAEVAERLHEEDAKLARMPFGTPEATVIRNYIETCLELPWSRRTRDRLNIQQAAKILDEDHDGLRKVKDRILEFMAVKQLSPKLDGQIICLVGPPGVGKSSIAKSIARATNRKYVRISLGGIRDEAEIRGHRKTYIGSMPGRIIAALKLAGSMNPVILLDEVDKLTTDAHGDPTSALLEVLDTDQNKQFRDHFIELPVDLSECLFIATANTAETIPAPLLDRMEVIDMDSYSDAEKLSIAKNHLISKQLKRHGLTKRNLSFTDGALQKIIRSYTKESGVRNLEREIASVCRKVARDVEVKYSTVQNWYPGDKQGRGGIYNFVTKRGICRENARLSWTQVETGSAITWKYPSCILAGDNSVGEFYSVAMTNNFQQADTGTKMIHIGRNTRSRIVSKGISAGRSENSYRGMVRVEKGAENARNYSQCDSLLIGDKCGAHTFPVIDVRNPTGVVEHEATTSKISDDQLFYCNQRGLSTEDAVGLIVNGYAREVLAKLPMEFAVEAQKLLALQLEGSVG